MPMTTLLEACADWDDSTDAAEIRAKVRAKVIEIRAAADVVDPDRATPEFDKAIANASIAKTEAEAWASFKGVKLPPAPEPEPPALRPVVDWGKEPEPDPVLWRDDDSRWPDAVLSVGEVAILSAPGGTGKSYVTLAIARAAATAGSGDHRAASKGDATAAGEPGKACGLRVRGGPVVLVSYEDAPVRLAARLARIGDGIPAAVHCLPDPQPLFVASGEDRRGEATPAPFWPALWEAIRNVRPSLVVIDPASAALADVSTSEGGPVRLFMRELGREAAQAGCGVLVVAHDTKAARNEAKASGEPGAGAVAGSAQWFDAARGVLYLHADPHVADCRIVECIKANHGRRGWGARLREVTGKDGRFSGFELAAQIEPKDMRKATKSPKPSDNNRNRDKAKDNPAGASSAAAGEFAPDVA